MLETIDICKSKSLYFYLFKRALIIDIKSFGAISPAFLKLFKRLLFTIAFALGALRL